jgi:hypothetical protein
MLMGKCVTNLVPCVSLQRTHRSLRALERGHVGACDRRATDTYSAVDTIMPFGSGTRNPGTRVDACMRHAMPLDNVPFHKMIKSYSSNQTGRTPFSFRKIIEASPVAATRWVGHRFLFVRLLRELL